MNNPSVSLTTDDLPAPFIQESPISTLLNPRDVRNNLTFVAPYAGIQVDDQISIRWAGGSGEGSYTSALSPVGSARPVIRRLDKDLVTFNFGRTVTLSYSLVRGTAPAVVSQPLLLYVLPVAQADLPRPFIPQASDGGEGQVLNVSALSEFTLRINAWLLERTGQPVWLRLRGTKVDGSAFDVRYWQAPENVIADEFNRFGFYARNYPAAPLQGLRNHSALNLHFSAGLQRSQDESLAQVFAERNYIVMTSASATPVIRSATGADGQDIPEGADTRHTRITLSGSARAGEDVEVYDEARLLDTVRAQSGLWQLELVDLAGGRYVFTAKVSNDSAISAPWRLNVVLQDLPLSIREAPDNGRLDPLAATQSLTAVLLYDMLPDDRLRVSWIGAAGTLPQGSHTTNTLIAGATKPREVPLSVSVVPFNLGKKVSVTFTYERGLSPPVTSAPFFLMVGDLPASVFIPPVFTQANGTTLLDLRTVTNGATLQFGRWPHIAAGQKLWLDLEGTNTEGEPHERQLWTGDRNSVTRSWAINGIFNLTVLFSDLSDLADGSTLTLRLHVNLDGVANRQTAIAFTPREYTIVTGD